MQWMDFGEEKPQKKITDTLFPAQAAVLASKKRFIWFCAGIGSGKCLRLGTKLLLASGMIIEVQNLRAGDVLMGWDSTPRPVTSVCKGRDTMYTIQSNKFGSHTVNSSHILTIKHTVTGEIIDIPLMEFLELSKKRQKEYKLFTMPVDFPQKELELDPYFAGLWIGDGTLKSPEITSVDREIIEWLHYFGGNYYDCNIRVKERVDKRNGVKTIALSQSTKEVLTSSGMPKNVIYELIKKNLIKNKVKNIPHHYLSNSRENRLKLLAGLLDTDGYYDDKKVSFEITTKQKNLAEQYTYLARSLGFHASCNDKVVNGKVYHRIYISGDIWEIPTKIKRKQARKIDRKIDVLRSGFKVIKLEEDDYYGFTVIGDGRVLLDSFVVTHNTRTGSIWTYQKILDNPTVNGFIAANTYNQLYQATLPPFMQYLRSIGMKFEIGKMPPASWGIEMKFPSYKNAIVCENGAHIYLRSLDKPEPIRGIEIGWGWIDEIASSSVVAWDIITGRMRDSKSRNLQLLVTGSPDGDQWTWQEFRKAYSDILIPDGSGRKQSDLYDLIFMSSRDNHFLEDDYITSLLVSYDPIRVLQEVDARILVQQDANIYHQFNSEIHIGEVVPYDKNKPLIFCWDFNSGKDTPMCSIICQEHQYSDGTKFVQAIDEIVIYNGNTPKVCEEFKKRFLGHRAGVYVFGDASGNHRGATTGKTDYQIIKQELQTSFPDLKFSIPNKNGAVKDRINRVNAMFRNGNNDVRFFIARRCKELIIDFQDLKPDKNGGIEKSNPSRSHCSDAVGYFIMKTYPIQFRRNDDDQSEAIIIL